MFSSFLKIAIRIFVRDKTPTLMNIFSLAVALTFSIIIFLYAYKELSFDRFHQKADRIYRIGINGNIAGNYFNHAVTPGPLAETAEKEIPEIESAVRVARFGAWLVRYGDARYNEDNIIFTDPNFFEVFSFPLIKGQPKEVLSKPSSIVLSHTAVERYFGNEDPVGKRLRIENDTTYYTVTGIMEDIPENSQMQFDMAASLSTYEKLLQARGWALNYLYTYVLLNDNAEVESIQSGLDKIISGYIMPAYEQLLGVSDGTAISADDNFSFVVQPLTSIHLKSDLSAEIGPVGKILYIYIFIILAIFILVLASLNFVSLSSAQSVNRSREVGIRKVVGSGRGALIRQFLIESSLLTIFALMLALLFTELSLPSFSKFLGPQLKLGQLLKPAGVVLMFLLIFIVGIISGFAPAMYLSEYNPANVLRNTVRHNSGRSYARVGLVMLQLFIAIGAITMTFTIFSQYKYLLEKDKGYNAENVVVIRRSDGLGDKLEEYKQQILESGGVLYATSSTVIPGGKYPLHPFYPEGAPVTKNYSMAMLMAGYDYDSTYGIQMLHGRYFDRFVPEDSKACVINKTAMIQMGLEDPVGKKLYQLTSEKERQMGFNIIGVIDDFNFETLENPILPLVIRMMPDMYEGYISVKISPDDHPNTIGYMKSVWDKYTVAYPFVSFYLDGEIQSQYQPVRTTARVFVLLSIIALLLAGLGLFAMISYSYNRRKQIIGLQKVVGASNFKIILQKASEITQLILFSSVLAWIATSFVINAWLKDYAYHIQLNVMYFIAATIAVMIVSLLTIFYHAKQTAKINPAVVLKYE